MESDVCAVNADDCDLSSTQAVYKRRSEKELLLA